MSLPSSSPMTVANAADYVGRAAWCVVYGGGIIGSLVLYGLLQERIMTTPYDGELFRTSVFLVLCNRIVAVLFSCIMVLYQGESFGNKAPLWKYMAISLSSVYASACQYEALKYVSFPVQMLGKSFKMMPVMVWGMIVSSKVYKTQDWAIAGVVTAGVTGFLMSGPISDDADTTGSSSYGLMILVVFLALDGFTSTFQEMLFKQHQTSKYNQMLFVNVGSSFISIVTLLLSGSLLPALTFAGAHPAFVTDAGMLSASAVCGQWFIYSQVKEFGALVFAATMNVRQVVSILVSYSAYGHTITLTQAFGLALVFAALFYKSCDGMSSSDGGEDKKAAEKKALEGKHGVEGDAQKTA
eukprot:TRINITY_DN19690_c0_g1_i1.p1 TRINITY_DN19690_c0_g1~~TRINITY_DN19690_c0_g1_i1.p1  ORF type:complete len:354 (-),score=78.05 TRINITY_DN19690_c0_g1_i1:89-1150(-)